MHNVIRLIGYERNMSKYANCEQCNGYGYFKCVECVCPLCSETGKIKCTNCENGYISCPECKGLGKITKKFTIFSYQGLCKLCEGKAKLKCKNCSGAATVKCAKCSGIGRMSECKFCGGTSKIKCDHCHGTGKVESKWYRTLFNMTTDQLRFEYEKRQRKVQLLQMKITSRSRELDELYEWYERERARNPYAYNGAGGYPQGLDSIPREISRLENEINDFESEMSVIEEVLNTKWR